MGRIGFINGMDHNYSLTYEIALYLSHLSGGYNVHITHNATHGLVKDSEECLMGHKGLVTPPVWHLHHQWDAFFNDPQNEGKIFLQICHSQGGIHVRNALDNYPKKYHERIKVVAIAPGGYVPIESKVEAHHYISADPVPFIDSDRRKGAKNVFYCPPDALYNHGLRSPIYYKPLKEHLMELVSRSK